ncbi:MAG: LytTR family transcriptional regulator DNA-binding domain-containing protein, partial [Faecalibacillus sp.]
YYIKKDNLDLDFPLCLNKIMKALSWENHQKLIITWNKKVVSFYYREIKYIQTNKNYVMIHTIKDTKIRSTFKNILKLIKNDDFIVISYGIIVNMRYIKCIDFQTRLLTMDNYETFSLSRKYIKDVKEKYQKKSFVFKIYR